MSTNRRLFDTLFWKISGAFMLILVLLGVGYVFISTFYANIYFQEANQRVNKDLAAYARDHVETFNEYGEVDTTAIQQIMNSMMVINPSVEVYLLDPDGKILEYVAPYKKVKLESVSLEPIKEFIASDDPACIFGDDPRDPAGTKVFSAAPIIEEGHLQGYYYVILAGEKQSSVTSTLFGSYILRVGTQVFFVTLLIALLIGLLAVWFLTRNLREIIDTVRRFKEGDFNARIDSRGKGELTVLANTYNEMADTLASNIEQLKAVENLRRELIANVSHDLRTPLAIMQGYVETMMIKKDSISEEETERYLKVIFSSSEKMGKLIAQLFEYSKLEAEQVQPQKEPFFLSDLAQDVFQKYEILAKDKDIQLDLNTSPGLPMVFADVSLVERVFQNLIDNALKFTPEGGKVSLELAEQGDKIAVKVSDTGPGIPENEQSFIFERYHRMKTGEAKDNGSGAGLGLAIVKKILEIHSATIEVISRPEQGASFMFSLPVYEKNGAMV